MIPDPRPRFQVYGQQVVYTTSGACVAPFVREVRATDAEAAIRTATAEHLSDTGVDLLTLRAAPIQP